MTTFPLNRPAWTQTARKNYFVETFKNLHWQVQSFMRYIFHTFFSNFLDFFFNNRTPEEGFI